MSSKISSKPKSVDFEKSLAELEKQVGLLEGGELSLEDALKSFESGIKLARECQQALTEAEQKVQILLAKSDGSVELKPFGDDDDSADNTSSEKIPF